MNLRCEIFDMLRDHIGANIAKRVSNVVDVLKLAAQVEDFPPVTDRIALANGTLYLDGTFQEGKSEIVRNRLPVKYDLKAVQPVHWLQFLSDLLYPEDIPTVQEFIGYCLIPSNKGQRMMVIKGSGGEGKSQIGVMLSRLFVCNMKDGSIGKISENRFARADLEHILLCVDDDMRMEVLRQTNYVKSIVTAQGQMDLERKGKQSYEEVGAVPGAQGFATHERVRRSSVGHRVGQVPQDHADHCHPLAREVAEAGSPAERQGAGQGESTGFRSATAEPLAGRTGTKQTSGTTPHTGGALGNLNLIGSVWGRKLAPSAPAPGYKDMEVQVKEVCVCEAMKSPVGLLSGRAVLRQQDGGALPRQAPI